MDSQILAWTLESVNKDARKPSVEGDMSSRAIERPKADYVGVGLYTPAEAAVYARLQTQMLNRWLFPEREGAEVIEAQLGKAERIVTFRDFVQALAIRAIRRHHGISLQKIREAVDRAERDFGVRYPLARKHRAYLLGKQIIIRVGDGDAGPLVQVTGKKSGHLMLREVVEVFMKHLSWDADGFACQYECYSYGDRRFTMNPQVHFGEPVLNTHPYSVRAILGALETEGTVEAAAKALGVEPADVEAAVAYDDYLQAPIAA